MAKGKNRYLSVIMAVVMMVAATTAYVFTSYRASSAEAAAHPKPAQNQIVKSLLAFHKHAGSFPQTFKQVQDEVWHYPQAPKLGDGGRSFTMGNYYYLLGPVNAQTVTLWAVPIGKYYKDGSSYFILIRKLPPPAQKKGEAKEFAVDFWKGPALDLNQVATLKSDPTDAQLANLLMTPQTSTAGAADKK